MFGLLCRNNKVFNSRNDMIPDLFKEVQIRTYGWITARDKNSKIEWSEWKMSPMGQI